MNNTENIVNSLFEKKDNLVPVIGDEMFCYVDEDGCEIPLQSIIVNHFKDDIRFNRDDKTIFENKETLLKEMETQGYYGMTLLYNHYDAPNTLKNAFKKELANFYRINREKIHLRSVVKEFLLKSHYPLIVTTSPFDIIEKDLKYNSSIFYDAQFGNDETILESGTCVYHLFGPKRECNVNYFTSLETRDYVTNEKELLQFLHAINKTQPTGLIKYMEGKFLMVLGCCLPNWFFRFLIYPFHNYGEVFLINNIETSEKLDYYLYSVGYNKSCHIDTILQKLTEKIDLEIADNYENDVFLSIAHEDEKSASKLKKMLESEFHIKVWLYSDEIISGNWPSIIKKYFNKSKFFAPYITENYVNKFLGEARIRGKISGLEECINKIAIERINREDEIGNNAFVLPILKSGIVCKEGEVTPQKLTEWANVGYCPIPSFFAERQCYLYTERDDTESLKDCMEPKGYKTLNNLLMKLKNG